MLRLIRVLRNKLAPVHKIPAEILSLIPDFWIGESDPNLIAMTHVCHAWREILTSRSSLWTSLDCENAEKTRAYLERSKSSPIDLSLYRDEGLLPGDPLFEIDPRNVNRLKSLEFQGSPESLGDIAPQLSYPAPLLENLAIEIDCSFQPERYPTIAATLFGGDLSSLRELCLHCVRTELPWRNMVNLTSFTLAFAPPEGISTTQLLDFFECASYLREVKLHSIPLARSERDQRVVSLTRLKRLAVSGRQPTSPLIGHLSIPVGATLESEIEMHPRIEDHLPKSLGNLKNLSNFTKLCLVLKERRWEIQFIGPKGQVRVASDGPQVDMSGLVVEFLSSFDTSAVERLEVINSNPLTYDLAYRLLLPMKTLDALAISGSETLPPIISALNPDLNPQNALICSNLEEFVLRTNGGRGLDVKSVMEMRVVRASRGAKLESVRILGGGE